MESVDSPSRLTADQRGTLAAHLARYPNVGSVILVNFPRLWQAARRAGLTPGDIRSACHDGLMRAAAKYAGRHSFKTFAVNGSRWAVLREIKQRAGHPVTVLGDGERVGRFALRSLADVPQSHDAGRAMVLADNRDTLKRLMRVLDKRQVELLVLRFGLGDGGPLTLDELAKRFGITRERVRQLEARSLLKLRDTAAKLGIDLTTEAT